VGQSNARQHAALNPYQSPRENCETAKPAPTLAALSDFYWWRVYLLIHVAIVIATLFATFVDRGYLRPVFSGETMAGIALILFAMIGMAQVTYASPILILVLTVRSFTHDRRYALGGLAELLLPGTQVLVALPLCQ